MVLGKRVWVRTALSLRRSREQALLVRCVWTGRVGKRLGGCSSSLCKPRWLDRSILIPPTVSAHARPVGIARIESRALLRRKRGWCCCIRAPSAALGLRRSCVSCWMLALALT